MSLHETSSDTNFDVSLTVHLSITLANDQLDTQILNTFITILYMYMFRAISCSSSGGQIVLIQHLVSSLSVSSNLFSANRHSPATWTEVFPCFILSCKANARVKPAKTGRSPHSSKILVLFSVLFVLCRSVYCLCVNVYCTTATGWLPNCS